MASSEKTTDEECVVLRQTKPETFTVDGKTESLQVSRIKLSTFANMCPDERVETGTFEVRIDPSWDVCVVTTNSENVHLKSETVSKVNTEVDFRANGLAEPSVAVDSNKDIIFNIHLPEGIAEIPCLMDVVQYMRFRKDKKSFEAQILSGDEYDRQFDDWREPACVILNHVTHGEDYKNTKFSEASFQKITTETDWKAKATNLRKVAVDLADLEFAVVFTSPKSTRHSVSMYVRDTESSGMHKSDKSDPFHGAKQYERFNYDVVSDVKSIDSDPEDDEDEN